jgi:hypothetical protein
MGKQLNFTLHKHQFYSNLSEYASSMDNERQERKTKNLIKKYFDELILDDNL